MNFEKLAFDRATMRLVDVDGRLHVKVSHISKAAVNPYLGREIPNSEALGLEPDRAYQLLRDPGELAKAVGTFNNIPLLNKHIAVSATEPQKESIVGSTGTDAVFVDPYLDNSLVIWDASAIAGIQTNEQRELSSAYRYVADMTPGVYEGVPYDGRMTEIVGNHVALVPVGRAGADVLVSDSLPEELIPMKKSQAAAARAALGAHLQPQLAQDGALPTFRALFAKPTTVKALAEDAAKAFPDAKLDVAVLTKALQFALDEAEDPKDKPAEDEDDEDEKDKKDKKAEDEDDEDDEDEDDKKASDEDEEDDDKVDKKAMDSALKAVEQNTIKRMNAIRAAEDDVRPLIGAVVAQDSAEAVYKLALDHASIDVKGVHPSAYRALVNLHKKGLTSKPVPRIALDAASEKSFAERFPTAGKLKRG
ncbi:DUF2213 domain-containing protein [Pseudomonas agarici]|uniref:DUF2213 domain-containing protein n=1 Tax=Pseudomonas agarici TaxID=46677 RepID=UPI0002FD7707|nr:DUF2213 domain-containing protein [Pseudomonas agarici]NWC11928.1 DUF2213 domain-containing protein [Pseudomonas agarici]SEL85501.1 hypothetical protein SAMN05216604_14015 [Pseudomonas agarici]